MAREKKIEPDQPIEILFTPRERDLILEHTFADGELTDRLRLVEVKGRKLVAKYTLEDLDALLGCNMKYNHTMMASGHTLSSLVVKTASAFFVSSGTDLGDSSYSPEGIEWNLFCPLIAMLLVPPPYSLPS